MRRLLMTGLAAGVVGLAVPGVPAAQAAGEIGGFATNVSATPVRVEIWERSIPLPTEPQAELDVSYTQASGTSGPQGAGRASYLWPGAAVGDGFKTIADQLQLPPEIGEGGYPFQVKAAHPGGEARTKDEPFPGMVMRAGADAQGSFAKAGFSSTGDVKESEDDGAEPSPASGPLPPPPTGLPSLTGSQDRARRSTPAGRDARAAADEDPPNDGGLGALSQLVELGGASSVSRSSYATSTISSVGTATLTDLNILQGVITADQLRLTGRTASTLEDSTSKRSVQISGLEVGGTPVRLTEKGLEVGPSGGDFPDLGQDPDDALAQLGIKVSLPTVTTSESGDAQEVRGIQVEIVLATLRNQVDTSQLDGPLGEIVAQLPDQLGPLKGFLGLPTQARPRIVLVLGDVVTDAAVSAPVSIDLPTAGAGATAAKGGPPPLSGGGAGTGSSPVGGSSAGSAPLAGGETQEVVPTTTDTVQPTAAGLPPLGSVPGMLLLLGIAVAGGAGFWLQKVGGVVLGAGSACVHGLESGVPDLRKAR